MTSAVLQKLESPKNKLTLRTGESLDLSFDWVPEWQRTKHIHRLHPYLGKFIPQLVEAFLKTFFDPGDVILDPFLGSGTTIVEGNILGMPSLGVEISPFNTLIAKVKTQQYQYGICTSVAFR